MFRASLTSSRARCVAGVVLSALTLASSAGSALAADRGGHGASRGGDRGGDRGHGWGGHDGGRFDSHIGFGSPHAGFGLSLNFGHGFYDHSHYVPPVYHHPYYPPAYVYRPYYCPSPVYVSAPPVVYTSPTVVYQDPVVVQQPVAPTVVERPVYVNQPAPTPVVQQPYDYRTTQSAPQPAPQQQTEAGRYQDRDLGDAYLRVADFANASRVYGRYLTAWNGDGTVMRSYGLAMVGRGEVQDGFRAFVQGYRLEPTLFQRPARPADLGGNYGFQTLIDSASRGASGTNTPEGWFTFAMLNHYAGNRDAAVNALQRARDAGLDTTLLDAATLQIGAAGR